MITLKTRVELATRRAAANFGQDLAEGRKPPFPDAAARVVLLGAPVGAETTTPAIPLFGTLIISCARLPLPITPRVLGISESG